MSSKVGKKNGVASKIIGIQFSIPSPEEIRRMSVAEITSKETYINNRPAVGGLFDPRMGILEPGLICPTDGHTYIDTPGFFGHIELARPVYYIQYLSTVLRILRCVCFKCSKLLCNKSKPINKNLKEQWDHVFHTCSKIKRCGDENDDGCSCKQPDKIKKEGLSTIIMEWNNIEDGSSKTSLKLMCEDVLKILKRISDDDITYMGFSPLWSKPEWMICQVLAVPPPSIRPSVKHDANQRSEDDLSHILINIIKTNITLNEKLNQDAPINVIEDWTTVLQYYVATMVNNKIPGVSNVTQRSGRPLKSVQERLNGKFGRIRGNLMGKRVDFSSRSVITPDASLKINQLGVPLKIAKNLTFPERANTRNTKYLTKLVENGPDVYPGANILERKNGDKISLRYVDRKSIVIGENDIVHRHLLDGDIVLFNRQPTLHRMSMMAHEVKVMKEGNTFRMNVADTKPYNADFDGDEMNMHAPQSEQSVAELRNLVAVSKHLITPASNQPIIGIFQDSMLGCYRFTRDNISFTREKAMDLLMKIKNVNIDVFKNERITNFNLLTQIMPSFTNIGKKVNIVNGEYVNGQINKSVLHSTSRGIIHGINNDFGPTAASEFIDNLQDIITEYMKLTGYSVGISDLIANDETNRKIVESITNRKKIVKELSDKLHLGTFDNNTGKSNAEEFETQVNSILNKAQDEAGNIGKNSLSPDNRFLIMVEAGSKGKALNIVQMISCLGQQNVDGKRIPYGYDNRTLPHYKKYDDSPEARGFVESSFIQGLTPQELFFHAMGGRVGLIDTAVKTSQTGYIQRRLIKGMEDICVKYDMTCRNNKNKIVQFSYGSDGINPMFVEAQTFPIISLSTEDIYNHYTLGDVETEVVFSDNLQYSISSELTEVRTIQEEIINYVIGMKDKVVKNIFNNQNEDKIHIPVHFERLILNTVKQTNLSLLNKCDISPLEFYKEINNCFESLGTFYVKPTPLFKLMYYYSLTPKNILINNRFNKESLKYLLSVIRLKYKQSIINPGEMVGIVAAQSIGEPTTQMTLNTFHFAGVASKSNVTRGVPRIEEILTITDNPKNPSITVALPPGKDSNVHAQDTMYRLEYTVLRDVVNTTGIYFEPKPESTRIDSDRVLMENFVEFEKMIMECQNIEPGKDDVFSKWVVRIELDKNEMIDRNITMDDVNMAIKSVYDDDVKCVYSDYNSDNLVFRIRLKNFILNKKKITTSNPLDQTDKIYILHAIQENMLDNIIIKGIKDISKVHLRKQQNTVKKVEGEYVQQETWVLDTDGSNLLDILALSYIDCNKTTSNHIQQVHKILGVEAARQTILNELTEVLEFGGDYVNYHHLEMLCDRMTYSSNLISIFRHGINSDDIGPLAKASFEETPEMFLRAARHAEVDNMRGISANVMMGQKGYYGTNSSQLLLDTNMIINMKPKELNKEVDVDDEFKLQEQVTDNCAINKLEITDNMDIMNVTNTGEIPVDYDLGI